MKTILSLALLLAMRPAQAGDFGSDAVGTTGSEFLTIDAGARGVAMAGAYTAATDDAYSLYWNPAGLTKIPRASAVLMNTQYLAGINYYYAAYAQHFQDGVIGGALRYLDFGTFAKTDINGNSQGSFHPRSFAYEVGYGRDIPDLSDGNREVSAGLTGRWFQSDMVAKAGGFAMDLGVQARDEKALYPFQYGLVVQNLGRGQKFDQVRDSLPMRVRMGAAVHWTPQFLLSLEAVTPASNEPYGAAGAEFLLGSDRTYHAALRAGVESQSLTGGLDGFRGFSLGLGLSDSRLSFDYAFAPYGPLGNTHRFSMSYAFPDANSARYRQR
ncbi:MAG: PorV/PorQ family protein [Elusimicrobia bacterium]|nr:PorV/PorQ family protein [Elusimicrobiota bacterium]